MKETTLELVRTVFAGDENSHTGTDSLLRICRQRTPLRKLIRARDAMEILQVFRPTLRACVKNGVLQQINFSRRKIRFDEEDIRILAYCGTDPYIRIITLRNVFPEFSSPTKRGEPKKKSSE